MTEFVQVERVAEWPEADPAAGLPPVWWSILSEPRVAFMRCQCGRFTHLTDWEIADDGTVSPSYYHVESYCNWHVFLRLIGWEQ